MHNKAQGQFFTPYPIYQMIARMAAGRAEDIQKVIAERGLMIAQEPAVGSGAMIIAVTEAILEAGLKDQQFLHVTAVDIDSRAVHMAHIQFSLLHIPATLIVGDSLAWGSGRSEAKHPARGLWLLPAMPRTAAIFAANSSAPEREPSATAVERNGQLRLF
nr:N-6 DNA methylase [Rhizobium indigoferae]